MPHPGSSAASSTNSVICTMSPAAVAGTLLPMVSISVLVVDDHAVFADALLTLLPMVSISVLVVDDHAVFADALQARLSREPDLAPVAVAYSANELRAQLTRNRPDVVVLDLLLGDRSGLDLAEDIRELSSTTKVIILTAVVSVEPVITGLSRGLRAWLPKTVA